MTSAARVGRIGRTHARAPGRGRRGGRPDRVGTRPGMGWRRGGSCSTARSGRGSRGGCGAGASASGPVGEAEHAVVAEAVFASIVLDRIRRIDEQAFQEWRATAVTRFDRDHRAALEAAIGQLDVEPARAARVLRSSPIGCGWVADRLRQHLQRLDENGVWDREEAVAVLRLLGRDPDARYPDRLTVTLTLLPAQRPGYGGVIAVPNRGVPIDRSIERASPCDRGVVASGRPVRGPIRGEAGTPTRAALAGVPPGPGRGPRPRLATAGGRRPGRPPRTDLVATVPPGVTRPATASECPARRWPLVVRERSQG